MVRETDGGGTFAEHAALAARYYGDEPPAPAPEFPALLRYIWSHFWALHQHRGSTGFGPAPLTWTELASYATLCGVQFQPWEARLVMRLDELWLTTQVPDEQ